VSRNLGWGLKNGEDDVLYGKGNKEREKASLPPIPQFPQGTQCSNGTETAKEAVQNLLTKMRPGQERNSKEKRSSRSLVLVPSNINREEVDEVKVKLEVKRLEKQELETIQKPAAEVASAKEATGEEKRKEKIHKKRSRKVREEGNARWA